MPARGGGTAARPLGSSPVHGRGDTAVYSSTLPPSQHHPHSPQLPQGSKHSSLFLNVLCKAACSGWGGCLCCTDRMMGQEVVKGSAGQQLWLRLSCCPTDFP